MNIGLIGLASLTFKKKELFQRLVADALNADGAYDSNHDSTDGLKTALALIRNTASDIMVMFYSIFSIYFKPMYFNHIPYGMKIYHLV